MTEVKSRETALSRGNHQLRAWRVGYTCSREQSPESEHPAPSPPRPTGNQRPSSARARCWRDTGPSRPGPGTPCGRQVPAFRRIWRTSTVLSVLGLGANLHQTLDGPSAERKAAIEAWQSSCGCGLLKLAG